MSKKPILAVLILALASMACGINIPAPTAKTPGPDVTDKIAVPRPDAKTARLTLEFAAGDLTLAPGAKNNLVEGSATYNIPDFKPEITSEGAEVLISQGEYQVNGIPSLNGIKNEWDLLLGDMPTDLVINAGAYQGQFELGGLALTSLEVNDGAAEVDLSFSEPNTEKMSLFTYKTGASNVTLSNLGNANFSTLSFESGAGNYTLDFGSKLLRDGSVTVRSGMSNLTLVIPEGMSATIKVNSGLSNVSLPSGWSQQDNTYTQEGSGPTLTIIIEMGAGNVQITQ